MTEETSPWIEKEKHIRWRHWVEPLCHAAAGNRQEELLFLPAEPFFIGFGMDDHAGEPGSLLNAATSSASGAGGRSLESWCWRVL